MIAMNITINLSEELFTKLDSLSVKKGVTLQEEIVSLIEVGLSAQRKRFLESIIDKHDDVLQRLA